MPTHKIFYTFNYNEGRSDYPMKDLQSCEFSSERDMLNALVLSNPNVKVIRHCEVLPEPSQECVVSIHAPKPGKQPPCI